MTTALIQTDYTDVDGIKTYTFAFDGGSAYSSDKSYRPPISGDDRNWGAATTNFVTVLEFTDQITVEIGGYSTGHPYWEIVGPGLLPQKRFPGTAVVINVPISFSGVGSGNPSDNFGLPRAFPLPFSPALPAGFFSPDPTHVVYGGVSPFLYSATEPVGLRPESIDLPWYIPDIGQIILGGSTYPQAAVGGPLDDRIVRLGSAQDGFGFRQGTGDVLINRFFGRSHQIRHWPFQSETWGSLISGFETPDPFSPPNPPYVNIEYFTPGSVLPTVVDVYGSWVLQEVFEYNPLYYTTFTVDVEANCPSSECYAANVSGIYANGYNNGNPLEAVRSFVGGVRPRFPFGAVRDAFGPAWLPGRALKVGQIV